MSGNESFLPESLATVLVIEDEDAMRKFVIEALRHLGFPALAGTNVEEALAAVARTPTLRLVLSDVCLERGTGPELVRTVLRTRPDLKVIFMSGGFEGVAFRRTDPILSKPFDLVRLRSVIESVMNASKAGDDGKPSFVGERRRSVAR